MKTISLKVCNPVSKWQMRRSDQLFCAVISVLIVFIALFCFAVWTGIQPEDIIALGSG